MKFQDKYQKSQIPPSDRLVQARVAAQKDKLGAAGILGTVGTAGVLSGVNSIPNSTKKDPNLSVDKFNTMDPSGKIRNRKVVGPEEVGPKEVGPKEVGTIAQSFDKSYSSAKKDGLKSFKFKGGTYSTESYDLYDTILEHLITEGYADTNENALVIMANMSEDWKQSIVEGGFNSSGRYDVGGGRTVGPVAGAVRSLFGGNLPKGQTYVPPSPQNGTNRPPAVPSSKGDSGKLTDFGAGGGKAKLKTGMSVGQVERQGRRNKGDYSG